MKLQDQVVSLELVKKMKELGFKQESLWWWVNSDYSAGFEGGDVIWLCDDKWNLYNFKPDPEYDDTGKITKEEGLIPDYFLSNGYSREKHEEYRNKIRPEKIKKLEVYSAYTVAELGEILPTSIKNYNLSLEKETKNKWYCAYYGGKWAFEVLNNFAARASTEVNARAKMLIYLKEKELI